jgi:hypothetical protein
MDLITSPRFAGDPDPNFDFDTRLLGVRLVKITMNFDDPAITSTMETVAAIQARFSLSSAARRAPRLRRQQPGYGNIVCHPVRCGSILAREASRARQ